MPEYVHALHEFTPENPDEVPLKVGDKIEVIEKDDLYGDGWWKGKNPKGEVGLFPQSYTSPNPPSGISRLAVIESSNASSASSTVEAASALTAGTSQRNGTVDPIPSYSTEDLGAGSRVGQGLAEGEVMKATMTDVQKAIEQLGRGGDDGSRSFSFASSHSRSTDHSEVEDEDDKGDEPGDEGFGWSKGARTMLAMRAQLQNEKRETKKRSSTGSSAAPGTPIRPTVPPHDFELSDESEDEDEEQFHVRHSPERSRPGNANGRISEEDEEEPGARPSSTSHSRTATMDFKTPPPPVITVTDPKIRDKKSRDSMLHIVPSEDFIVPSPSAITTEIHTARPEQVNFPQDQLSPAGVQAKPTGSSPTMNIIEASPIDEVPASIPVTNKPATQEKSTAPSTPPKNTPPTSTAVTATPVLQPSPSVQSASPSASTVRVVETTQLPFAPSGLPSPTSSSFDGSGSTSSNGNKQTLTPATTVSMTSAGGTEAKAPASGSGSGSDAKKERPEGHPSEWSVEQVVDWLRLKGFDEGVCEKFIEQEISGDVLLELDADVLKTEIGIIAFGKRTRIVNAITDLRRPPSIFESPSHTPARITTPRSQTGQSLPYTHSHSASMQSSAPTQASSGWAYSPLYAVHTYQGNSASPSPVVESAPQISEPHNKIGWPVVEADGGGSVIKGSEDNETRTVGLGLGLAAAAVLKAGKTRPTQLVLSPSDSAIAATAVGGDVRPAVDEDRGAMSESETVATDTKAKSRRLFWRTDSGSVIQKSSFNETASRHSKDTSTPQSPPLSAGTMASLPGSATAVSDESKTAPATGLAPTARRMSRQRESVDGRKASDRLSLFGSSFSGTLGSRGKNRKPPPSLPATSEKSEKEKEKEKYHGTFSRIREKRSSSRPSTADGTSKDKKPCQVPSLKEVKESPGKEASKETTEIPEKPKESKDKVKESKEKAKEPERSAVLRKRTVSTVGVPKVDKTGKADDSPRSPTSPNSALLPLKPGQSILEQIGTPDHEGWLRKKGERYNTWKVRYFVLKGPHLYWLRNKNRTESKIKGYVNIAGYKVVADENIDPGRYGFRIMHEADRTYYFSSEEHVIVREWMKALMKATITRDYADLVVSSCNIPTIPLAVAQAMNPAPRPPSPSARAATQRAMRPDNPNQLTQRDAQVLLMGVTAKDKGGAERTRLDSFFNDARSTTSAEPSSPTAPTATKVPPRPSREMRRLSSQADSTTPAADPGLIDWANSRLPKDFQINEASGSLYGGLALLRLAESIKGKPATPRVPDSAFPTDPTDDKLDGLFRLFDFLLDNDVKMGTVSINDIRLGKRDKVVQLLKALRAWEEKRKAVAQSLGPPGSGSGSGMSTPGSYMSGPIGMASL